MEVKGKNQDSIQAMNRELILHLLQQNHLCSRIYLANQSGLKQATITNIINDFISWGIVEETGLITGNKGRRSIALQMEHQYFSVIGLRLTRKYFTVGLFSLRGELLREEIKADIKDISPDVLIPEMKSYINQLLENNSDKKILAAGVSVPGPYYYKEGIMEGVFKGWENVSISERLQEGIPIPVIVEHDANAGVLAECALAPDENYYETVIYLAIGQGIGAGVFHNGKLFRGATGIAGEVGHVSINLNGPLCTCGNHGCLTAYSSSIALTQRINAKMHSEGKKETLSYNDLLKPQYIKHPIVQEEFLQNMYYLSLGINNLIYTYNPGLIVIGDEICNFGDKVLYELRRNLERLIPAREMKQLKLRFSSFSMDPAFVGAAEVAITYLFKHTELFLS